MIEYKVEDATFSLSYQDLKEKHFLLCELSDDAFMVKLPEALHLAVVICFLKEIPSYICLSDKGIVHELVHLLESGTTTPLAEIRKEFEEQLKLI